MSDHEHEDELHPLPQHLIAEAEAGCEEARFLVNRRSLMGMSAGLFTWAYMPRHAEAAGTEPRLLVVLLRGGMDGLEVAPPVTEKAYFDWRGDFASRPADVLNLTTEFSLNRNMPNFKRMFDSNEAALFQAIAPPLRRRSHFEGLYNIESGLPGAGPRSTTSGWLNRLLLQLPIGRAVQMEALHIGPTPLILAGAAPVLSWMNVPNFTSALNQTLLTLYERSSPTLAELLRTGLRAHNLAMTGMTAATNTADQGISGVRINFRAAARMMRAVDGPRIAVLNIDGWDTHGGQKAILNGKLADLDSALQDFRTEIGSAWDQTVVVCVTEMGRTVKVNGSGGTDHGDASVAFLLGGAVAGGKVWGDWPGLAQKDLTDGRCLRATMDMRTLFKGILADHLGVPISILDNVVFPASKDAPAMKDLLKSPFARDESAVTPKDAPATGAGSSLADFRQIYGIG